ncbi:MAG: hypothetical protein ACD_28C00200G0007 [uncultured bacterium]|nr:MAG: hypothetical protein ACD_28C00200G0007 [uncultured bacterium]KKT76835.1 MAG: hypothetical protein UW70_C0011G0006 [Candidatus Peregrinibacteria bacterium GW2011_GWA2_44_7]
MSSPQPVDSSPDDLDKLRTALSIKPLEIPTFGGPGTKMSNVEKNLPALMMEFSDRQEEESAKVVESYRGNTNNAVTTLLMSYLSGHRPGEEKVIRQSVIENLMALTDEGQLKEAMQVIILNPNEAESVQKEALAKLRTINPDLDGVFKSEILASIQAELNDQKRRGNEESVAKAFVGADEGLTHEFIGFVRDSNPNSKLHHPFKVLASSKNPEARKFIFEEGLKHENPNVASRSLSAIAAYAPETITATEKQFLYDSVEPLSKRFDNHSYERQNLVKILGQDDTKRSISLLVTLNEAEPIVNRLGGALSVLEDKADTENAKAKSEAKAMVECIQTEAFDTLVAACNYGSKHNDFGAGPKLSTKILEALIVLDDEDGKVSRYLYDFVIHFEYSQNFDLQRHLLSRSKDQNPTLYRKIMDKLMEDWADPKNGYNFMHLIMGNDEGYTQKFIELFKVERPAYGVMDVLKNSKSPEARKAIFEVGLMHPGHIEDWDPIIRRKVEPKTNYYVRSESIKIIGEFLEKEATLTEEEDRQFGIAISSYAKDRIPFFENTWKRIKSILKQSKTKEGMQALLDLSGTIYLAQRINDDIEGAHHGSAEKKTKCNEDLACILDLNLEMDMKLAEELLFSRINESDLETKPLEDHEYTHLSLSMGERGAQDRKRQIEYAVENEKNKHARLQEKAGIHLIANTDMESEKVRNQCLSLLLSKFQSITDSFSGRSIKQNCAALILKVLRKYTLAYSDDIMSELKKWEKN